MSPPNPAQGKGDLFHIRSKPVFALHNLPCILNIMYYRYCVYRGRKIFPNFEHDSQTNHQSTKQNFQTSLIGLTLTLTLAQTDQETALAPPPIGPPWSPTNARASSATTAASSQCWASPRDARSRCASRASASSARWRRTWPASWGCLSSSATDEGRRGGAEARRRYLSILHTHNVESHFRRIVRGWPDEGYPYPPTGHSMRTIKSQLNLIMINFKLFKSPLENKEKCFYPIQETQTNTLPVYRAVAEEEPRPSGPPGPPCPPPPPPPSPRSPTRAKRAEGASVPMTSAAVAVHPLGPGGPVGGRRGTRWRWA